MSKGLEAFEEVLDTICCQKTNPNLQNAIDIAEKELEEGELAITYTHAIFELFDNENNGDFVIDMIAKQKKALEIIKNKNVNVNMFVSICNFRDGFEKYNELILKEDMTGKKEKNLLTQEEYGLLKEVLLWD